MFNLTRSVLVLMLSLAGPASVAVASSDASMCERQDKVVFSCSMAKGDKTASICAANNNRFYYSYGKPGAKADMVWPSNGALPEGLTRTHLGFAGGNGGYAFAFPTNGYKYIVYSIAGARGTQDGGVVVLHQGDAKVVKSTRCKATSITESDDDALLDATLKLPKDPEIQQHGLPTH